MSATQATPNQVNTMAYKNAASVAILFLLNIIAQPALGEADLDEGRLLAYTCMGCHGIEGYRNAYPSFHVPKLGGQKSAYIESALRAYRSGDRQHPTMRAQGASMTDDDIENLAGYLAASGESQDALTAADAGGVEAAALCVTCHGAAGAAVVPAPPTLAGQHEDYLVHSLQQYKNGERSGNVMAAFATSLTEADIKKLAELYASQGGLYTLAD